MYAALARRRAEGRSGVRFYRLTLLAQSGWLALAVLAVLLSPGSRGSDVGLAWPHGPHVLVAYALTAAPLAGMLAALAATRAGRPPQPAPAANVSALLPRGPVERRWAAAVAVGAGLAEESLCRGLLIAYAVSLGLPAVAAAAVVLAAFTAAHLYQGVAGMLGVGVLGLVFTAVYLLSGSLLLPILLHALVDLRGLLLVPPPPEPAA